ARAALRVYLGRLQLRAPGNERRDRGGRRAAGLRVVRHAVGHQVRAEGGVAHAQLAERAGVDADLLGRVAGRPDDDLLREEDDVDRALELLDLEGAVGAAELHEVQRG